MKTFKFQLEVEATPYSPDTVEELFGKGASYIPDYPEHTMASELISDMLKDAIMQALELQTNFIMQHPKDMDDLGPADAAFWKYLQDKEATYRQIAATLKAVP